MGSTTGSDPRTNPNRTGWIPTACASLSTNILWDGTWNPNHLACVLLLDGKVAIVGELSKHGICTCWLRGVFQWTDGSKANELKRRISWTGRGDCHECLVVAWRKQSTCTTHARHVSKIACVRRKVCLVRFPSFGTVVLASQPVAVSTSWSSSPFCREETPLVRSTDAPPLFPRCTFLLFPWYERKTETRIPTRSTVHFPSRPPPSTQTWSWTSDTKGTTPMAEGSERATVHVMHALEEQIERLKAEVRMEGKRPRRKEQTKGTMDETKTRERKSAKKVERTQGDQHRAWEKKATGTHPDAR